MKSLGNQCRALLELDDARQAIQFEGRWITWGEIRRLAEDLSAALGACGARCDAPVTIVARNRPAILSALIALLAQERRIRMVYAFQSPAAIVANIERLGSPAVLLAEEDFVPEIAEALDRGGMAGIVLAGLSVRGLGSARRPIAEPSPHEPCVEVLTSGTTGPPKHFPISYEIIARLAAGEGLVNPGTRDDSAPPLLFSLPIGNISGIYCAAASILQGRRTVLLDRFTLAAWLDYVRTYQPLVGSAPPAAISMILEAGLPKEALGACCYFTTGAAPLDPTVHRAFEERYGIPILQSYGATEFGGPVAMMTPQLHEAFGTRKFGSVGRAMAGVELRVVDPASGAEMPPGADGILEVVSPRMGPDWIRTSDLAAIDGDGFLWHRGRADSAIMRGGFKLLPETIERALMLHPAVAATAVVGVADERLYEVPAAAIQVKAGWPAPDVAELESHLRAHVLATHVPVYWTFVDDLPRTASFKVDRAGVRQLFSRQTEDRASPGNAARTGH